MVAAEIPDKKINLTHRLAEYVIHTEYPNIPEDAIKKAKLCLLDWIGVTLAGAKEPISDITFDLADFLGGKGQATILGKGLKTNLLFASLVNGTSAHALDFDDVHIKSSGHPSAPIIPAILALAEWKELSGRDFITAFIIGVQTFFSIGAANMPYHYDEGWHNTGTVGHLASAAASAKLLGLNEKQIVHALGIGATQAAGLQNVFGTMCKPFHAGKAAMNGLLAVLLAQRDFTSSDDVMGGKRGFLEVFSSKSNPDALEKALTGNLFINEVRFKRYPSCFATHSAIDCMIFLRNKHVLNPEEISEIQCIVYPRCIEISGIAEPQTGLEGKFSVQYCLAVALQEGKVLLESFDDAKVKTPSLTSLMKKVKLVREDSFTKTRTSEVVIKLRDGKTVQEKVNLSELLSDRKKEEEDVIRKFKDIAYSMMPEKRADQILGLANSLEKVENMAEIVTLCHFKHGHGV